MYYSGEVNSVVVLSEDHIKLQIPFAYFRSYVTEAGIKGRFEITYDNQNKFQSIKRLD